MKNSKLASIKRKNSILYYIFGALSTAIILFIWTPEAYVSKRQSINPSGVANISLMDKYSVARVIDGDTVVVSLNGKEETVRILGIDTPEIKDPRKPVQCFGAEASEKTKQILEGQIIVLESDPTQGDKDTYGRLLRFVFLPDGRDIGKLLIEEGFAHEYTYQSNPYKYQKEYLSSEKQAMENKKGLWADGICNE